MFIEDVIGCMPKQATKYSAGLDVFSAIDYDLLVDERAIIPLGFRIDTKITKTINGIAILLEPRSSMRAIGITSLGTGIIDADYDKEVKIILQNLGDEPFRIKKGQAIGQILVAKLNTKVIPMECLSNNKRTGGFGSTN